MSLLPCFFFAIINLLPLIALATVPPSETFSYVNEGSFGDYITEYDASYRTIRISASPFLLAFYNTSPSAYTLALRMGTSRASSGYYWVWEANRGNPVGENATFSLAANGNLVLAHADGRVAWHSNTAGKGVVGLALLRNGNMVLRDSKGKFVWQSFDSPTDTLLVGQSLRPGGPNKLVSRLSEKENKNGPYSMVLERDRFALYYTTKSSPRSLVYYQLVYDKNTLKFLRFNSTPYFGDYAYRIEFDYDELSSSFLAETKYNSTLTFLRLGIDGNLRAFTFSTLVDHLAWEETFTLYRREFGRECRLPERCGTFGLCEDSQCVACPTPTGLAGWTKNCGPPKLTSCKPNEIKYFKLEGVDHFTTRYTSGNGPIKEQECSRRCTSDCKCVGFFFKQLESRCWIVYDLKTLQKVDNSTHVAYIKAPLH